MATITERRAAADLRRRQAGEAGERGGEAAFRQYRSAAPHPNGFRRPPAMGTELFGQVDKRNNKEFLHTWGFFSRYSRAYPMWDSFGEYEELVARGAGRQTIASDPDVPFLLNHTGTTMARTRAGTLILEERDEGGYHDAWLNLDREDVRTLQSALRDKLITEMSFKFMIPEGAGEWSDDFMTYEIRSYDLERGDVSAVNYGANPFTDIAAQTPDVLDAIEYLPEGALREAAGRLAKRGAASPEPQRRERIEVSHARRRVDPTASPAVRRLQGKVARTTARYVDLAARTGMSVEQVLTAQLPWYEIRAQADGESAAGAESTDILIYDEIGGSFGVDAKTFAEDLAAITTPRINIRFNSPGGSVFDGEAIHSSIMHHQSRTVGYVDGLAASAASLILMACDEIVVMPAGEIMMHDASMTTQGNAADHGKGQAYLDRHSGHLADIYAARMKTTRDVARELMLAETWAFADEAIELGLADRQGGRGDSLTAGDPGEERMARKFNMGDYQYRYANREAAHSPRTYRVKAEPLMAEVRSAAGDQRSTAPKGTGRSIAYLEAIYDLEN
jgi:HK97 family phage prohead protease